MLEQVSMTCDECGSKKLKLLDFGIFTEREFYKCEECDLIQVKK